MFDIVILASCFTIVHSIACYEHCACDADVLTCSNINKSSLEHILKSHQTIIEDLYVRKSYIREVADGTFARHKSIKELTISSSYLRQIDNSTLLNLREIEKLDLSANSIEIIGTPTSRLDLWFNSAVAYLPNFKSSKYLRSVDLSNNNIKFISEDQLYGLKYVQNFNLSGNNIPEIYSDYRWLMGIKIFDASFNRITTVDDDFGQFQLLIEEIHLSHNYLKALPSFSKVACWNLKLLDLSFNEIEYISNIKVQNCSKLLSLNLQGNKVSVIQKDSFMYFPMLQVLHIGGNSISEIENFTFESNDNLEELYVSDNRIQALNSMTLVGLVQLLIVDFTNNAISMIASNAFSKCQSLKYIFLNNNKITFLPPNTFLPLTQLRLVTLRNNQISVPSPAWFYSLTGKYFVTNGEVLERKQVSSATIDGRGNPWLCDCGIRNFVEWQASLNQTSLNLECHFPRKLRGLKIGEIEHIKLSCDSPFDVFDYFLYAVIFLLLFIIIYRYYLHKILHRFTKLKDSSTSV